MAEYVSWKVVITLTRYDKYGGSVQN